MVGYDPDDPATAHGVGRAPRSFAELLDANALKGARIGILREPMGYTSEPASEDFAKITEVFDRAVAKLGRAGATIVDPIVIPDLNPLLAKRVFGSDERDEGFAAYFRGIARPLYGSREEAAASPLFQELRKSVQERWLGNTTAAANYASLKARDLLMTNMLKAMADHELDVIVHKAVEHQPTLIADGINPPYVNQKGAPHINTFLQSVPSIVVPAGFTRDELPAGITFLGRPYDDTRMIRYAYAYEQATQHRRASATTP
jgi:amidase